MIRATAVTAGAADSIQRVKVAVQDGSFDVPVEIAAFKCRTELIERTPKRWTGLTRRAWEVQRVGPGARMVTNKSKVMLFLEEGTGNAGTPTSNGGYIYPKSKKFLFIPKTSTASLTGWRAGMKYGIDFILARRVRGIKALRIVAGFRGRAREILKGEMQSFLQNLFK